MLGGRPISRIITSGGEVFTLVIHWSGFAVVMPLCIGSLIPRRGPQGLYSPHFSSKRKFSENSINTTKTVVDAKIRSIGDGCGNDPVG